MSRVRVWAGFLDPDFSHSQRVAQLALLLYDGLKNAGLMTTDDDAAQDSDHDSRAVLQAAALMHDVGKVRRAENHHKKSYRLIRELKRPLGWSARDQELAAVVARYHRGALPRPRAKTLQLLALPDRPIAIELAGILRLANALDTRNGGKGKDTANETSPRLEVSLQDHFIEIRKAGYSAMEPSAEGVAGARHLLETVLRRPVMVRTLRAAASPKQSSTRGEPRRR
jgi:exopolyphosphatase/pppGpp-phosphohydrolase